MAPFLLILQKLNTFKKWWEVLKEWNNTLGLYVGMCSMKHINGLQMFLLVLHICVARPDFRQRIMAILTQTNSCGLFARRSILILFSEANGAASGTTDCSSKADSAIGQLSHCQRALIHSSRISRRYYSTSCMSFSTSQPAQINNVSGCKD